MGWFRRKDEDSLDPQYLLAQAQAQDTAARAEAPTAAVGDFRLTVQDVFTISGRGTVVTGQVELGSVRRGDTLRLRRADGSSREVAVTGIEMFRKVTDAAAAGDNVGLLLADLRRDDIGAGDLLTS
jgi:translation elongation factor EF-Tu-like GTPase